MGVPETQKELFSYLRSLTRSVRSGDLQKLTTSELADALHLSRNLASHYLNDLVRSGAVVKAGGRPVYYFSRRDLERRLQASIDRSSYDSIDELAALRSAPARSDFEQAVGHDLSLAPAIESLKAAVGYPPHGLPVLMLGEQGVGKTLLARLLCEYGRRCGALASGARSVVVDCAAFEGDHDAFVRRLDGAPGEEGALARAAGGVLVFQNVNRLGAPSRSLLLSRAMPEDAVPSGADPRFVFLSSCRLGDPDLSQFQSVVPLTISIPPLRERGVDERRELVLELFKRQGRMLGADVLVSRDAFELLVEADFPDNVRGLASCITGCCAAAHLNQGADHLEVRSFMLPGAVLGSGAREGRIAPDAGEELIDTTRSIEGPDEARPLRMFSAMLRALHQYRCDGSSIQGLVEDVGRCAREYGDYLVFDAGAASSRALAYEQVLARILDDAARGYGADLSKKSARVLARCIHAQAFSGSRLARWRVGNQSALEDLLATLASADQFVSFVSERVAALIESGLGVRLDALSRVFLVSIVHEASRGAQRRQGVGVILCHGYATATSIADAANRMLGTLAFEAIDMSYDQQVEDVIPLLRELLDRYSFCREVAILYDMGSLEGVLEALGEAHGMTLGAISGVSTGMALEVGAGLVAGECLPGLLESAARSCVATYRVVEASEAEQMLFICSEGGVQASERIKALIEKSLPGRVPVRLVAGTAERLKEELATGRYDVAAVIGTDDPGLKGIVFIALEDLIAGEGDASMDGVFSRLLSEEQLAFFHQSLVKNLTLKNVIESITILNPEKVLEEVESAVERLQSRMGSRLGAHTMIGLCVHLCCLVERLVTRTPLESYADLGRFSRAHPDFIELFRGSFSEIGKRYGVEVPVAEIAYAYDYIHHSTTRKEIKR